MPNCWEERTEVRDGMRIIWDVPIEVDDGTVLRADLFLPIEAGRYPVIMSYGPYGKGLPFQDAYEPQWQRMVEEFPEVTQGSSGKYQNWEVADPEKWVPDGYVCVRVDSRGAGRSPGVMDVWSPREAEDFSQCIEWAGTQPWSNGKVGLSGISYYAMNQYQVAALAPSHLAAICPWEGAADWYRDVSHHGGILCSFAAQWFPLQVESVQHGVGERGASNPRTGEFVAGPGTLDSARLKENRVEFHEELANRPLDDEWYRARRPDWSEVTVPMLSAGNWGGHGLHLRGNIEAFEKAASQQKWLEIHGGSHWALYYTDYGLDLQKRFFDHFLKGANNGWLNQPKVQLNVRHVDGSFELRHEDSWPLPSTEWTTLFLNSQDMSLSESLEKENHAVTYDGLGDGVTFSFVVDDETEVTGPVAAKLLMSPESENDIDLFVILRVFDPTDTEVTFMGALDPNTPVAQGWLRASHRKLDKTQSRPYSPYHSHNQSQPLEPGNIYELDVEVWPTSIVIPPGYRIALTIRGSDFVYPGPLSDFARGFHYAHRGVGPFRHVSPEDRPVPVFGGRVALHTGERYPSSLILPVIPGRN